MTYNVSSGMLNPTITYLVLLSISCCVVSVWHGDYGRPSYRLRDDWHVRFAVGDWGWSLPPHHHSAVCCRSHRSVAWRAAAERLRTRVRNLTFHCYQHLRDNCLEGVQPDDSQHWSWYVARRHNCRHRFDVQLNHKVFMVHGLWAP